MKNRFILLTLLLLFSAGFSFAQSKQVVVVIDPGHGGKDVGHETTTDGHENEKHLNLKIAKFLGGYIEKYLDNVKVIYTRTTDIFVSLDDRVAIANAAKADYFISIHCNGNESTSVRGTETHVHAMSATNSVKLAKAIEGQFSSRAGRHSRGVKDKDDLKHSIQVLKFTEMTSVLVECGFITNEKEAAYLNTTYGQEILASAIYRAFRDFIKKEHPTISFTGGSTTTTTTEGSGTTNSTTSSTATYAIQIASSQEWIDTEDARFKSLGMTITRTKLNTTSAYKYIYTVGNYANKTDANAALPTVKAKGYKDAIVVKR